MRRGGAHGATAAALAAAAALAVLATVALARAAPAPVDVAVLRPADDDRVLVEAAARVRLELGASGLSSALVDLAGDEPLARLAFVREAGVATLDLLAMPAHGPPVHRRLAVPSTEGGDDPAVLAVRAAELLRGIRLEVRRDRLARAAPAEQPARAEREARPRRSAERLRLAVGGGALGRGVTNPSAVGPVVALSAAATSHLAVVGTFAGPFTDELAPTPGGSAVVRQEMATLGLRFDLDRARAGFQLLLATGFHHLTAHADARGVLAGPPVAELRVRTPQSLWRPVVVAGAAVTTARWRRFGAGFETDLLFAQTTLDIHVDGRRVARLGALSLLTSISLWVAFP